MRKDGLWAGTVQLGVKSTGSGCAAPSTPRRKPRRSRRWPSSGAILHRGRSRERSGSLTTSTAGFPMSRLRAFAPGTLTYFKRVLGPVRAQLGGVSLRASTSSTGTSASSRDRSTRRLLCFGDRRDVGAVRCASEALGAAPTSAKARSRLADREGVGVDPERQLGVAWPSCSGARRIERPPRARAKQTSPSVGTPGGSGRARQHFGAKAGWLRTTAE